MAIFHLHAQVISAAKDVRPLLLLPIALALR
jgi:hypothetical protein